MAPPRGEAEGLSGTEAAARARAGRANKINSTTNRTVGDIVRANVVTRFNIILGTLLVVVLVTREYRDALFGIVLVANAVIGIVQEVRAKRTLDRLDLVIAPRARALRDGRLVELPATDLVEGDVIDVATGDQLPVDGRVLVSDALEVDESLLTGESDPALLDEGRSALSGSLVVGGHGRLLVTEVGDAAYAARLAAEARRFTSVRSELRAGTDSILRVLTWALVPAAGLLVVSQVRSVGTLSHAVRGSVAGVAAMIPEGLVLLTSLAFAVGVLRLARRHALVQELAGVEILARVDTVCVDKTGTLTEGSLRLGRIEPLGPAGDREVGLVLGALSRAETRPNSTALAVAEATDDPGWRVEESVPFSSARKWSGATFRGHGSWLLGAPEILLPAGDPLLRHVEEQARAGHRIVLLAAADDLHRDGPGGEVTGCTPVALVRLEERIRPEARPTLEYFADQGVTVKVISGDHPDTVGAVARSLGVEGADRPFDARELPDDLDSLGEVVDRAGVFGRVQPHQKREMVKALQQRGHVVAMTGDGINDVLALKQADLGVAMGSGSGASRAVAEVILLDDSFASLPALVGEGRRVIANIERVANLFVTKSVYAGLLAVAVGILGVPFPFYPRHLTIVSSLTIGIPAFFLALAPNQGRNVPGFAGRVARFAVPAGATAAAATLGGYWMAGSRPGVSLVEERTTALIILFVVAMWVLFLLTRPLTASRVGLLGAMVGTFVGLLALPAARRFFDLDVPGTEVMLLGLTLAAVACGVMEIGWRLTSRWRSPDRRTIHGLRRA